MKKRILLAASSVAVGLGLGGCVAQTGFHWTNDGPKKGETVKGIVDLKSLPQTSTRAKRGAAGTYFYVILNGEGDGVGLKGFTYDPKEVVGPKVRMVKDADVANYGGANCAPASGGIGYRTKVRVNPDPKEKPFDTTFRAKLAAAGGGFGGFVSSGQWFDDGDGVAEDPSNSDDRYECSGFASTVLSSKGFGAPAPRIPSSLGG